MEITIDVYGFVPNAYVDSLQEFGFEIEKKVYKGDYKTRTTIHGTEIIETNVEEVYYSVKNRISKNIESMNDIFIFLEMCDFIEITKQYNGDRVISLMFSERN